MSNETTYRIPPPRAKPPMMVQRYPDRDGLPHARIVPNDQPTDTPWAKEAQEHDRAWLARYQRMQGLPPTYRQVQLLKERGRWRAGLSRADAFALIDAIIWADQNAQRGFGWWSCNPVHRPEQPKAAGQELAPPAAPIAGAAATRTSEVAADGVGDA
jgi:hypothetical protein